MTINAESVNRASITQPQPITYSSTYSASAAAAPNGRWPWTPSHVNQAIPLPVAKIQGSVSFLRNAWCYPDHSSGVLQQCLYWSLATRWNPQRLRARTLGIWEGNNFETVNWINGNIKSFPFLLESYYPVYLASHSYLPSTGVREGVPQSLRGEWEGPDSVCCANWVVGENLSIIVFILLVVNSRQKFVVRCRSATITRPITTARL